MPPSSQQFAELARFIIAQRARRRIGSDDKAGDHRGVDLVGLGPLAQRPGKLAHLRRIDDHHRQTGRRQRGHRQPLISAARLKRHRLRAKPLQPANKFGNAGLVIAQPERLPKGATKTSSQSFETSMPTTGLASIARHPCLIGLRLRPRRLFGFDGTADEIPGSPTGSNAQMSCGLASATAPTIIADSANVELQDVRR